MSFRIAKTVLDRPGGRTLLGHLVSAQARLRGANTQIFYDGCWIHRYDNGVLGDWTPNTLRRLSADFEVARRDWLSFYKPQPGDTIVEVGAGIGVEAILLSQAVGETGRIIAIEAHPRTYSCLLKTCEYNSLKNVTALNIALVDRETPVFLEDSPQHIGNAVVPGDTGPIRVRGRALNDVCTEYGIGDIALLRMNIEGAEKFAIQGMDAVLGRIAHVAIECHDFKAERTGNDFFRTKRTITEFLLDNGFRIVEMPFDESLAKDEPWVKDFVYAYNAAITGDPLKQ